MPAAHPNQPLRPRPGLNPAPYAAAFTLIELLVVIAIIALLMGIVLPSLAGARDTAKTMHCSTNLRSIGQSLQMYADENHETFPYTSGWHTFHGEATGEDAPGLAWTELLEDYLTSQEIYRDKARPLTPFAYFLQAIYPVAQARRRSVPPLPNERLCLRAPAVFFSSQFVLAGEVTQPLMFPEPYGVHVNLVPNADMDDGELPACLLGTPDEIKPHRGNQNMLFLDGHVDGVRRYERGQMTFDGREMRDWAETSAANP